MAKKEQKHARTREDDDKRVKAPYGGGLEWVLNNLSDDQLKHCDEVAPSIASLLADLNQAIDMGLEIKLGWDGYSKCWQASAIGAWKDFPSEGYATSARSSADIGDALLLLWYKIVIMSEFDLSQNFSDRELKAFRS